jgi:hypothetical protein
MDVRNVLSAVPMFIMGLLFALAPLRAVLAFDRRLGPVLHEMFGDKCIIIYRIVGVVLIGVGLVFLFIWGPFG